MAEKFIEIELNQLIKEKFNNKSLKGALKHKTDIEALLNNPEEIKKMIEEALLGFKEKLEELNAEYKKIENLPGIINENRRNSINQFISMVQMNIDQYTEFQLDNEKFKNLIKIEVESCLDTIEKAQKKINIIPDDIQIIISTASIEKENILQWIENNFYDEDFSEETKQKIKDFVEELLDKNKIYQLSKEDKINAKTTFDVQPIDSGIYTEQEFFERVKDTLSEVTNLIYYLEAFRKLFPEQFPSNMSAIDIFKKYDKKLYSMSKKEEALLEKFDEVYYSIYDDKKQSIEDTILNGNNPISFTTITNDDKVK